MGGAPGVGKTTLGCLISAAAGGRHPHCAQRGRAGAAQEVNAPATGRAAGVNEGAPRFGADHTFEQEAIESLPRPSNV